MAKKAGKKTQSNRSNKTRRNVRNRKNTKKQKRRTNKQNRKKRATRKRHGVKRGGAAEEPAAEERKLPAMVSPKGDFVELMAHHLNNREIYECVTVVVQQGLDYNEEYKPMMVDVASKMNKGIVVARNYMGNTMTGIPQTSFIRQYNDEVAIGLMALKGEKYFDRTIIQPRIQSFYDLGTLLYSLSNEDDETITELLRNRQSSGFKTMIKRMLPFMDGEGQDASQAMTAKIIENVCILIQGHQKGTDGVVLYRRITNRISNIYKDLAQVVSIVYNNYPTIVLTLIRLIISSELVIKTLAKNTEFFPVESSKHHQSTFDFICNRLGLAQCPNIAGPPELIQIKYSRLLFSGEPLIPLELNKILEEKNIWWENLNEKYYPKKWMDRIPMTPDAHDRPILLNAIFSIISDLQSEVESLDSGTFYDILKIVIGMHTILKNKILEFGADVIGGITTTSLGDIKTSIIQTIEKNKDIIIDGTFKTFNSLEVAFKKRIMNSIDKVIDDLVARYVYVDIKINKQQDLVSKDVLEENNRILKELLKRETQIVVNNRWQRLDKLKQGAEERDRDGRQRVENRFRNIAHAEAQKAIRAKSRMRDVRGPWRPSSPRGIAWQDGINRHRTFDKQENQSNALAQMNVDRAITKRNAAQSLAHTVSTMGSKRQRPAARAIHLPLPPANVNNNGP